MVYKWYILPIGGLYGTYHPLREPGNSIDHISFILGFSTRYHLLNKAGNSMDSLDKKDMAFETNLHQGSQQLQNKV